jgi:hypothetical protein
MVYRWRGAVTSSYDSQEQSSARFRAKAPKGIFPETWSNAQIEKAIHQAYRHASLAGRRNIVLDPRYPGGASMSDEPPHLMIEFCPFCGAKLPDSLRGQWCDRLDQPGLEPDTPELPLDMRSGAWWRRTRASP